MGSCCSHNADRLEDVNLENLETVPNKNKTIKIRIIDVYDGDTFTFIMWYNKGPLRLRMRLINVDAPEIKGLNVSILETQAAVAVRDILIPLLNEKILYAEIYKWDKYGGRIVGDIYLDYNKTQKLSEWLLGKQLVKPYTGKQCKSKWSAEELKKIITYAHLNK